MGINEILPKKSMYTKNNDMAGYIAAILIIYVTEMLLPEERQSYFITGGKRGECRKPWESL